MKQVTPGESTEPVKIPAGAEPAESPQQALANYTAQANPGETTPVPQPARGNEPAAEVKNTEVKDNVVVNPSPAQTPSATVKAEPAKETKPAEVKHTEPKPAEAKPTETKLTATKPLEPKAPPEPAKTASAAEVAKASAAKTAKPVEEIKPTETKAAAKPEDKSKLIKEKSADTPTSIASSSKKLTKLDENAYVLQIMVTNSAKKIEDMLAGAPNKKDLAAYKTIRDGKEVYILVEGEYPSANEAAAAAKNLPSMQQSAKPWPKKVGLIHAEIKSP
jgi:septal ring-binding cell division protein DamX